MLGFHEGTWYTPGPGGSMMIARYRTGLQFVMQYASSTVSRYCSGMTITAQKDRSDLVQSINQIYAREAGGMSFTLTAGEISFGAVPAAPATIWPRPSARPRTEPPSGPSNIFTGTSPHCSKQVLPDRSLRT